MKSIEHDRPNELSFTSVYPMLFFTFSFHILEVDAHAPSDLHIHNLAKNNIMVLRRVTITFGYK